jgi:hypothetical protein
MTEPPGRTAAAVLTIGTCGMAGYAVAGADRAVERTDQSAN